MAVAFPTNGDKTALLSFMSSLSFQSMEDDDGAGDKTSPGTLFGFEKESVEQVESSCSTILGNLQTISNFFTGGGPLTGRKVLLDKTAFTSGSVYPHFRNGDSGSMPSMILSDVSAADIFGIANPADFFGAQQEDLAVAKASLESAKETLQRVNQRHAYIWTGDLEMIRTYIGSRGEETLALMYHPAVSRRGMRPAEDSPNSSGGGHANAAPASTPEEVVVLRALLALPFSKLPSSAVKEAYARFIQTTNMLIQWLTTVLQMVRGEDDVPKSGTYTVPAEDSEQRSHDRRPDAQHPMREEGTDAVEGRGMQGIPQPVVQAARTRKVRVRRYEIRDAHYSYDNFHEQARCFFLPEYTQYDARVQRRLLQPSYFSALRDLLGDMTREITYLSDVAARKNTGPIYNNPDLSPFTSFGPHAYQAPRVPQVDGELPEIVFRPPLSSFRFLRDSLRIYLSTCIHEDDTSSLLHYERVYDDVLAESREVAKVVQRLPKPPKPAKLTHVEGSTPPQHLPASAIPSSASMPQEASLGQRGFDLLQVDHAEDTDPVATAGRRLSGWPPTHEERGLLVSGFEAYWDVRGRIHELRDSLSKDIKQKDRTHVTRATSAAVLGEVTWVQRKATTHRVRFPEEESKSQSPFSLWGAVKSSFGALGSAITCQAELNPGDVSRSGGGAKGGASQPKTDDEGFPLTEASPFHAEKTRLAAQISRLWSVMEAQGAQLEATYPGVFFRGERQKWADRVGKLVKKAEGVSVVFSA